jgi:hypothetical protein
LRASESALLAHLFHDLVALAGHDIVHRALAELLAQTGIDGLRQAGLRARLVAAGR